MSWVKDFDNQTRMCSHSSLNSSRQKVREDRFVRLRYRWTPSSCNLKLRPSFVLKKLYNPFHRSDKSEMLCFVYISSFISLQKISLGVDEERLWITKIIPQGNSIQLKETWKEKFHIFHIKSDQERRTTIDLFYPSSPFPCAILTYN